MHEEALAELTRARQLDDNNAENLALLGHGYAAAGRRDQAHKALAGLHRRSTQQHVTAFCMATVYAGLGEKDEVLAWLEKAYSDRDEQMVLLNVEQKFDGMHSTPGFRELIRRMKLAP